MMNTTIPIYILRRKKAKIVGQNIWSIPGYVDKKNGFDMDVVIRRFEGKYCRKSRRIHEYIKVEKRA
ncbi:hypothetical protein M5V91_28655 (plasmid) [Cytobacillus pseudoceanisediminis]|uniref:hypothetical protein n=1 Tax=Cytobacillus pseudoceanisediminis TaxID=3051614 RepID=UPI002189F244|nr:hypothetical protein [Cytobacillus pseudoceanisediminis]UQX57120.1 hypothetical protein M5V91_28655 [Cytobacillus pseudoceanisediminis]